MYKYRAEVFMDLGLTGKKALIFGASTGLGRAIAIELAMEGAQVTLCSRSEDKLASLAESLSELGCSANYLVVDLSSKEDREKLVANLKSAQDGYDILINNGGGPPPSTTSETTTEQWLSSFNTMLLSTFEITQAVLPHMRKNQWGRVINVVSNGVIQPIPNLSISNTLRASVIGWAKTLSNEEAANGITVNSILPGRIDTDRLKVLDANKAARTGASVESVTQASLKTIPAGRYGKPDEFAAAAVFLASDRAGYITGSMMRVDGGLIKSV
jgi:3-oxoacyl-[acyl-carrier protein] reductase